MKQAKFQVLLILDSKTEHTGPATPFKRAWCGYEMSMTLAQGSENITLLDVATCEGTRPTLVTMGLTKAEDAMEIVDNGSGYKAKAEREKGFNLEIVTLAMNIQVQNGQTVRPKDKQKILNSIAQRDLNLPADMKHESYNKYNARLRSMLALGFWRRVWMGAGENSEAQQLQQKVAQALKGDEWRDKLDISMAYMSGSDIDDKILMATKNFPKDLKHLNLDLRGTDLTPDTVTAVALALPRGLLTLNLDLAGNPKVENSTVEHLVARLPPNLASLRMGLQGTGTTKELDEKRNSLEELRQHIIDEAEKGHWYCYTNLCPSPTGRMIANAHKFKVINGVAR